MSQNRNHGRPSASIADTSDFLTGGGELGALMRSFDWSATPLGPPQSWPQSLKTAVRIMLNSRQPIWIGWGDALIYLYNDPYKSIIGGKHPWALGRPTEEVWKEIWKDISPMLATAMGGRAGTYVEAQLLIMERNGYPEETYYTFSYSPIPNDDGSPGGIFCANTDETERVIGERQLATLRDLAARAADARTWEDACEKSMDALCANAKDLPFAMIYAAEPDGQTASLAAACGIGQGHPAAPASLTIDSEAIWPICDVLNNHEARLIEDLGSAGLEFPCGAWNEPPRRAIAIPISAFGETGRGSVLIAGLNPYRLYDDHYRDFLGLIGGQIAAAIANAQAYEEERRRAEALAEIDRAKTLFFSNVSHEFRTPLTLMLGPLEELLAHSDRLQPQERTQLESAHRNSLRLLKLVNTLLDFSRIEAGRAQAAYAPTDLSALTAELAGSFQAATEKAGLRLIIDCPPLPKPVYVDHDMWEKIVLNLLSNAFKFTFEGEIAVEMKASENAAELTVRDTGTGIPAHELPRLFERFHRIEGARGRSFEGSGIGLALVQELVRLHGGAIRVDSEENRGSAFTVSVPFSAAHLPKDRIGKKQEIVSTTVHAQVYVDEALRWLPDAVATEESVNKEIAGLASLEAGESPRASILFADDNADMRDYVRRLLGSRHAVETVPDGQAALDTLRQRRPDLLLTDVMMPRLDGNALVRAIRQDPELRDLPVIALSARTGPEARLEGLFAGADDYLVKPFSARELISRVEAHLNLARLRTEAAQALRESEQRYRELVSGLTDAIVWEGNPETFEFTFVSQAAETLLGYPVERWLTDPGFWVEQMHPEDRDWAVAYCIENTRAGRNHEFEYRMIAADGGVIWLHDKVYVNQKAGGERVSRGLMIDITDRKQNELARQQLISIFETSNDAIVTKDLNGIVSQWNAAAERLFGYSAREMIGKPITTIIPQDHLGEERDILDRIRRGEGVEHYETIRLRKDGSQVDISLTISPLKDAKGKIVGASKIARDITDRKRAEDERQRLNEILEERVAQAIAERETTEAQLQQAQKMEAVGRLTGGVAHDFNNLLQVIGGNLQMLEKEIVGNGRAEQRLRNALEGVARGAKLASQLLAFARRQALAPKVINLGRLVRRLGDMLRQALGEGVEIETIIAGGLWNAMVDPSQVETALLNLAINARDAMEGNGKLTVEAGNAWLDDAYAARHDIEPGQYVMLAVSDTGCGMPPEIIEQVFEPFFTTKPEGQGTGLGLSMVYGFVKQSGGHVKIYSEPGQGTTIRLYLPRVAEREDVVSEFRGGPVTGGSESILVVEDDENVRMTVVEMLSDLGYQVLKARDAQSAFAIVESGMAIDLLFTDVVMPGPMRSIDLARKTRERLPNVAVLFTSGYTDNAIVHGGRLDDDIDLLSKPYTREALAWKVRHVLQSQSRLANVPPPRAARETGTNSMPDQPQNLKILLVEDDVLIRMNTADMLTGLGHAVMEAHTADDALKILHEQAVEVLLTDVSLPGISGVELALLSRRELPDLRIIFATGHESVPAMNDHKELAGAIVLPKPYNEKQLADALSADK